MLELPLSALELVVIPEKKPSALSLPKGLISFCTIHYSLAIDNIDLSALGHPKQNPEVHGMNARVLHSQGTD